MDVFVIDAFKYCRLHERREGTFMISELPRLADELANTSGFISWILQGGLNTLGYSQLTLSVTAGVQLICQRCLDSFPFDIASHSNLILAKDEVQADEIDALLDDDAIDVIVGSNTLSIVELIEDEILLAIPLVPKHAICPDQSALDHPGNVEKIFPSTSAKDFPQ